MDRANNTLKIKISGKNQRGESFQEIAQLESFGSFGMLIHTAQPFNLSDMMHICGMDGSPLASAEVVWVRSGEKPAVEVLLHRNINLSELARAAASVSEAQPIPISGATTPLVSPIAKASSSDAIAKVSSGSSTSSLSATMPLNQSGINSESNQTAGNGESILCNNCNKPNPVDGRSCKHCGSYLSRTSGAVSRAAIETAKASGVGNSGSSSGSSGNTSTLSAPKGATSTLSTPKGATGLLNQNKDDSATVRRPPREQTASPRVQKQQSAQNRAALQSLQQFRKIAMVALIVLTVLLSVTLLPIGLGTSKPTAFDVVQQTGCLEANVLKRQVTNSSATGDLEVWAQSENGALQFIRREITAGDAVQEIERVGKGGTKLHGYWCPKFENKPGSSNAPLPGIMALPWTLKPVGTTSGELTLQIKDNALTIKEKIDQNLVDRTPDIKQATYYTGMQKLVIKLGDTTANVKSAGLKELTFYLPSNQDPVAAAEGELSNTTRPYYIGQPNPQDAGGSGLIFILQIALVVGIAGSLLYLAFNFIQSRKLA